MLLEPATTIDSFLDFLRAATALSAAAFQEPALAAVPGLPPKALIM